MTRPQTPWDNAQTLLTRGLPPADVAFGLGLPETEVRAVAGDVQGDGSRALYVDGLYVRVKGDPRKLENAEYLYVRGVTWGEALRRVDYSRTVNPPHAPKAAREAYRKNQIRLACAGILP